MAKAVETICNCDLCQARRTGNHIQQYTTEIQELRNSLLKPGLSFPEKLKITTQINALMRKEVRLGRNPYR